MYRIAGSCISARTTLPSGHSLNSLWQSISKFVTQVFPPSSINLSWRRSGICAWLESFGIFFEPPPVSRAYILRGQSRDDTTSTHFLPWSFVTHDLIWNLTPIPKAENVRKSDAVPSLSKYLANLVGQHANAVQIVAKTVHSGSSVLDRLFSSIMKD